MSFPYPQVHTIPSVFPLNFLINVQWLFPATGFSTLPLSHSGFFFLFHTRFLPCSPRLTVILAQDPAEDLTPSLRELRGPCSVCGRFSLVLLTKGVFCLSSLSVSIARSHCLPTSTSSSANLDVNWVAFPPNAQPLRATHLVHLPRPSHPLPSSPGPCQSASSLAFTPLADAIEPPLHTHAERPFFPPITPPSTPLPQVYSIGLLRGGRYFPLHCWMGAKFLFFLQMLTSFLFLIGHFPPPAVPSLGVYGCVNAANASFSFAIHNIYVCLLL